MSTVYEKMKKICDNIRLRTGGTELLTLDDIAEAILTIGVNTQSYTNQVPISIDSSGSIYNGTGYKNGYRLSSSGSESANDEKTTVIGFVKAKAGDTVRIKGYKWYDAEPSMNYFIGYNSSFTKVYTGNARGTYDTSDLISSMSYDETTGISTVVIKSGISIEYIRISVYDVNGVDGANLIVTVNEEITD